MDLNDFDYALDEGLVASYPLSERDASRLMLLERRTGRMGHALFRDLSGLLRTGDVLVLNDTRVFPARLIGRKATGGRVEFLLVEEEGRGISESGAAPDGPRLWRCLVRPAKGLGPGREVSFGAGIGARVVSVEGGGFLRAEFRGLTRASLHEAGLVPIPPYMRRAPEDLDRERYQTVFASKTGAVAAPTAGLHFTPALLERIGERGVEVLYVTLHTGPATFLPIRGDDAGRMGPGSEAYSIEPHVYRAVMEARREGRRVVAVGTTTLRALESAALGPEEAPRLSGKTDLFVTPGFEFRIIDGLITNFHLPCSTLLMLAAAFAGHGHIMKAYAEAVKERYRFYSYGDAMFIS